jgi:anti-sigma factor RsiW
MNVVPGPPGEAELHAYADGHLTADRVPAVEAWLAADPEARGRVAAWRRQNDLITRLYEEKAGALAPVRLPRAWPVSAGGRRTLSRVAVAASAALLVGGAAGWLSHDLLPTSREPAGRLTREGIQAHHAFAPLAGDVQADPARLGAELSRRLDGPVRVPDLAPLGLRLLGGRAVLAGGGEPTVHLAYADAADRRFSLYLVRPRRPDVGDSQLTELGQANALYWPYAEFRCVLVGDAPPDRLLMLARVIEAQIAADDDGSEG